MRATSRSRRSALMAPIRVINALALGPLVLVVALLLVYGPIAFAIRLLVGDTGL